MKRLILLTVLSLTVLSGCMTIRNGTSADNAFPSGNSFNKKKIAILPVKSQASITTDSHTPLKKALNKKLLKAVQFKMANAVIMDSQKSLEALNNSGKLDLIEKLLSGFETTGAFDKKIIASICSALKSEYLIISKLKIEQMDVVIAKDFSASLEVMLIGRTSTEPVWNGIGDFKRGGIYGAGGTETDEAATELVTLAFGQPISNSQQNNETAISKSTSEEPPEMIQEPIEEPLLQPVSEPVAQPVEQKIEPRVVSQSTSPSVTSMIVIENKAKLRKTPSTKSAVIKNMKKGEVVQLMKQKDGWCLIELAGGETGWCVKGSLAHRD